MRTTRSNRPGLSLLVALAFNVVAAPQPVSGQEVSDRAFLDWVKDAAIPVEDWEVSPRLEAYLDEALKGKRILFLGEPGHFFHEKYEVQLMLIRHLAKKGYRHLFVEGLGASRAPVWDAYVQPGAIDPDAETGARDESEVRKFREQVIGGMVSVNSSDFKQRQVAEERRFYDACRQLNRDLDDRGQRLHIHPFDLDTTSPGGCYFSLAALLEPFAEDPKFEPLRQLADRPEDETPEREVERLESLREYVVEDPEGVLATLPPAQRRAFDRHTDCLLETKAFFNTSRIDGNMVRALVRREPAMFRQVQHALKALPPEAKVILLGHNNHLGKLGSDITRARRPSMGELIDAAYPGEVFSIWMLHDHGRLLNPMNPEPLEDLESDPARIESLLVEAGSTYLLPLHTGQPGERHLDRKRTHSYFSWSETCTLTTQTDALFFIDEITPLRK